MSAPTAAVGGTFVTADTWLSKLHALGYRAELRPGSDVPLFGGDLELRLGHPTVASNRDVYLRVEVELAVEPEALAAAWAINQRHWRLIDETEPPVEECFTSWDAHRLE